MFSIRTNYNALQWLLVVTKSPGARCRVVTQSHISGSVTRKHIQHTNTRLYTLGSGLSLRTVSHHVKDVRRLPALRLSYITGGVKTLTRIISVTLGVHYAGVDCQLKTERLWLLSAGANSQSYTHRPAYTVVVEGHNHCHTRSGTRIIW